MANLSFMLQFKPSIRLLCSKILRLSFVSFYELNAMSFAQITTPQNIEDWAFSAYVKRSIKLQEPIRNLP